MSDVRKDIEKSIKKTARTTPEYQDDLRKLNDYMEREGKTAHDWTQDYIAPYFLYPAGGLVGGAISGSIFGGKLKRLMRGRSGVPKKLPSSRTGAMIGGAIGGPTGVYGSLKHQELSAKRKRARK